MTRTIRIFSIFFCALTIGFCLSGCGKKPSSLDAPAGTHDPEYPRQYPAPLPPEEK